ncbi:hypothetical protein [Streptomyces sp. NPDC021224]|uniref:hypothetical protein n=1 Tax=unclassified Streptomyces TaxID=2593676 RepID=UPI00379F7DDF
MTSLRPTPQAPGLHVVCPPRRGDGVASADALCHCGWQRSGIGAADAEAVVAAYTEHRQACAAPTTTQEAA